VYGDRSRPSLSTYRWDPRRDPHSVFCAWGEVAAGLRLFYNVNSLALPPPHFVSLPASLPHHPSIHPSIHPSTHPSVRPSVRRVVCTLAPPLGPGAACAVQGQPRDALRRHGQVRVCAAAAAVGAGLHHHHVSVADRPKLGLRGLLCRHTAPDDLDLDHFSPSSQRCACAAQYAPCGVPFFVPVLVGC